MERVDNTPMGWARYGTNCPEKKPYQMIYSLLQMKLLYYLFKGQGSSPMSSNSIPQLFLLGPILYFFRGSAWPHYYSYKSSSCSDWLDRVSSVILNKNIYLIEYGNSIDHIQRKGTRFSLFGMFFQLEII